MVTYRVEIHHAQLRIDVGRMSVKKMEKALTYAHVTARLLASEGPYSRGRLQQSLMKVGPISTGLTTTGHIVSDPIIAPYAAAVERGAEVHSIFPKRAPFIYRFGSHKAPMLKFRWRGRLVYTPHVPMSPSTIGRSHPGQKAKHFLRRALERTAIRYNMRIIVR